MVGIAVLTIVASMAKRKITSITPSVAKFLFSLAGGVEVSGGFTSGSASLVW
jgi:hypothetical protein